MENKTIFDEIKAGGIEFDHHFSDLYIPVNDTTKELVKKYFGSAKIPTFISTFDKSLWYDIPFAYSPFWDMK